MRSATVPAVDVRQGAVIYLPSPPLGNLVAALVVRTRYEGTVSEPLISLDGLIVMPGQPLDDMVVRCTPDFPIQIKV